MCFNADFSEQENRIIQKIRENGKLFEEYRLFLANKNNCYFWLHKRRFYMYGGMITESKRMLEREAIFSINRLRFDRGEIIAVFTKIEFIINEILLIQSVGNLSKSYSLVESFLDEISLDRKFEILRKKEDLITNKYRESFTNLKKVRNEFAHVLEDSQITFKNQVLNSNNIRGQGGECFDEFKKELTVLVELLLNVLKKEQGTLNDIEGKVDEIIEKNDN